MVKDVGTPFAPSLLPVSASLLQIIGVERSREERKRNAWLKRAGDAGNLISFWCPLASWQTVRDQKSVFTVSDFMKCCRLRKGMLRPKYWLSNTLSLLLFRLIVSRRSKCFPWILGVPCRHVREKWLHSQHTRAGVLSHHFWRRSGALHTWRLMCSLIIK